MHIKRTIVLGASLIAACMDAVEPFEAITFFSPRPQTTNAAQELMDDQYFLHQHKVKPSHFLTATIGYYQSLQEEELANIIFDSNTLVIDGSFIDNRESDALLADYFGLSPAFKSIVHIAPHWQSVYLPFTFYWALDDLVQGMYLRICVPFVWNQSTLKLSETILSPGTDTLFPADYMAQDPIAAPYASFIQALQGDTPYGFVKPLQFGVYKEKQSTERLANTTWDLGWNIILDYYRHFGLKLRVVTPNGTRPTGETLFEPLAGNCRQWELGCGINGHTMLWEGDDDQEVSIYLNLLLTHLFNGRQHRSFDIKPDRFLSRYMLVKEFDDAGAFTGNVSPLINHTTLACNVNVAVEFDGALMLTYTRKHFTFDFGYNGWIRSKEKISLCNGLPNKKFGLKGIQNVIDSVDQFSLATQSTATIFGNNFDEQMEVADPESPKFLYTSAIDLSTAGSPVVFSHKLFTYLGYTGGKMHKHRSVQPCIGIGSEIEFQGINKTNEDIQNMNQLTLSQWSIFLKAGILFG